MPSAILVLHKWSLDQVFTDTMVDSGYSLYNSPGTAVNTYEHNGLFLGARGFADYPNYGYISCGNPVDTRITTQDFSVLLWFRYYSKPNPSTKKILLSKTSETLGLSWEISVADGYVRLNVSADGFIYYMDPVTANRYDDFKWHLVVVTRHDRIYRLYMDSCIEEGTDIGPSSIYDTTAKIVIGNRDTDYLYPASNVDIDNVMFFDVCLSQYDIDQYFYKASLNTVVYEDVYPLNDDIDIPVGANVQINIKDVGLGEGVDISDVYIDTAGAIVYDGSIGGFQPGYTGEVTPYHPGGFSFNINPDVDFNYEYLVRFTSNTQNLEAAGWAQHVLEFTTEDDVTPPVIASQDPAPGALDQHANTDVYFQVLDYGTGVDSATLQLYVDRGEGAGYQLAYDGVSGWEAGWSGSLTPVSNGYSLTANPDADFLASRTVQARVIARDNHDPIGNLLDTSWSFSIEDVTNPHLQNQSPPPSSVDAAKNTSVYLEIVDDGFIDEESIAVYMDKGDGEGSKLAYSFSGGFETGWSGSVVHAPGADYDLYQVTLDSASDYLSYALALVRVLAEDQGLNTLDTTYSFRVVDYVAPVFGDRDPYDGEVFLSVDTSIYLELSDVSSGINASTMRLYVDRSEGAGYELVYHGVTGFQTGWSGSVVQDPVLGNKLYRATLDADENFLELKTILVRAVVSDNGFSPNEMDGVYSFTTAKYPSLSDVYPTTGSTGVDKNTNIALSMRAGSSPISLSSILVRVNGTSAYDGTTGFQVGFRGPFSSVSPDGSGGFDILIDPEESFSLYEVVEVEVYATDLLGHDL